MKPSDETFEQKQLRLARLRREVDALRIVAALLSEQSDLSPKYPAEPVKAAVMIADKPA